MTGFRIIADENIPQVEEVFAYLGEVITVNGRKLSSEQLEGADILLVRSVTEVSEALLAASSVRFVGTATIGTDHLDIDYLQQRNIGWANAPGCNADSVADYVISALCRLEGVLGYLLTGGSVGIVGMGNVGARVYQRLAALGITCCGYDPLIDQQRYPILGPLEAVLACDLICLHAPLTTTGEHPSYHLFDEQRLSQLTSGAVLINAGRGAVVDNQALKSLLEERDDLCTVLDVWEHEPEIDIELLKRIDLASPHIAGYSLDGKLTGTAMIHQACCEFLGLDIKSASITVEPPQSITLNETTQLAAAIKEAVLASYDIAGDDQRFRGTLLHTEASMQAEAFDSLRKNYPVRREFSRYVINNMSELDEPVRQALQALGFSS